MLKRKSLTYAVLLSMMVAGTVSGSCRPLRSSFRSRPFAFKNNISNSRKPKTVQLKPSDCPWDKCWVIKNSGRRKTYGAEYARRQNKKLKSALD